MNVTSETWPRRHRLTVDEYYRMAEVGLLAPDARVELIDGEIVDMPPIGSRHASVVGVLNQRLTRAVGEAAFVWVQSPVLLDEHSAPQPDLALLRPRADHYAESLPGPADVILLVEVSDTTLRFDRGVKARLYARHRIPELWIADLPNRCLRVCREPGEAGFGDERTVAAGLQVAVPGLSVDVDVAAMF